MHADREEGFCNDYDGSCPGREVPGIASRCVLLPSPSISLLTLGFRLFSCYTLLQCTLSQPAGKLAMVHFF